MLHHIDIEELASSINSETERLVIWGRPETSENYPFPASGHQDWHGTSQKTVRHAFESNGFQLKEVKEYLWPWETSRENWCSMLKQRFWSNLRNLTDEEIDEYIAQQEETIKFNDRFVLYIVTPN